MLADPGNTNCMREVLNMQGKKEVGGEKYVDDEIAEIASNHSAKNEMQLLLKIN